MAEPRSDDRSQARREAAILLGVDIEHLSAADSLRVDMVSALRLVIDHEQASVLSGGSADLGRLNVAVASLIGLLPGRELPAPAANRPDPRQIMWQNYLEARRRGALCGQGYDGKVLENERLKAKIAELEAALAAPTLASPLPDNVVPMPPPPSAPASSPPAAAAPASAAPPAASVVLGDLVMVVDPSPDQSWKSYVEPDGSIRATPFGGGKYWGPV